MKFSTIVGRNENIKSANKKNLPVSLEWFIEDMGNWTLTCLCCLLHTSQ